MPINDLAARTQLLESAFSDLKTRVAILERAVTSASDEHSESVKQARANNVPTRVALVESNLKGLSRLMWVILVAILTTVVGSIVQIALLRGGK